ncbi:MAG: ATP-binding cassette domain-containing protein [Pseudomonadota bacterium]
MSLLPLTVEGAEVRRRGRRLLGPVNLTLTGPGITVVVGPNGAGKSTLLRLLHGLERPRRGRVSWSCSAEDARNGQAMVLQRPVLLRRSVGENLTLPLTLAGRTDAEAVARVARLLGLEDSLDQPAHLLSGGEAQRLSLGRAFLQDHEVLFLDEPTSHLDRAMTQMVEHHLASIAATTRIVMATHSLRQARALADDVIFVEGGQVHAPVQTERFFNAPAPEAARAFLEDFT